MRSDFSEKLNNEARDWFTLMQSGSVTELEQQQLQHWLSESAAHQDAYRQYEAIWQDLGELATSEEAEALRLSVQSGVFESFFGGINNRVKQLLDGVSGYIESVRAQVSLALASVAVVALIVVSLSPESVLVKQYSTGIAEIRQLTLEDGSLITLGAKSEIKAWATDTERHVELVNGQAFFDVAKNPQRPFWVNVGDTRVKVVGTQFDIRKGSDGTRIAVLEGIVNVFAAEPLADEPSMAVTTPVVLTAGLQVVKPKYGEFEEVKETSVTELEAWRHGRLVFRNANLADVVADANRYFEGTISLGTRTLSELKVTLALRTDQVESLPEMLSHTLPITTHRESGNRIVILPRPVAEQ